MNELRALYSLLRRGMIGRAADAYFFATILNATIWPGLLVAINSHLFAYVVGIFIVSLICDLALLVSKPDLPACGTDEPELDFKDEDK